MPSNFDDLNSSSLSTSNSVDLSAPKSSNSVAPSQSQQISHNSSTDRPKLKRRDPSDVQRLATEASQHEAKSGDLLSQTRDLRQGIDALLEHESDLTAHAIADAPHRLQELINQKIAAYGYDYADLTARNAQILDLWK